MEQRKFEHQLLEALKKKYGRKPTARQVSMDLYRVSDGQVNVSPESVRKWLIGSAMPRGAHLIALMRLLQINASGSEPEQPGLGSSFGSFFP
jgi:hypothetical protein